jgi:hypothetical protein
MTDSSCAKSSIVSTCSQAVAVVMCHNTLSVLLEIV